MGMGQGLGVADYLGSWYNQLHPPPTPPPLNLQMLNLRAHLG